ncbi:MAG: ABC transporter ATP-binding protein, partial [Oscillospiraceae bacterium]|nr:ABC transporter ATP-binding protein [Oscillospiraceae bacterium]
MKLLWRLAREASRFKGLYAVSIFSMLLLTGIALVPPMLLREMTQLLEAGTEEMGQIMRLALLLLGLYLL